jgi:hypothetical protein
MTGLMLFFATLTIMATGWADKSSCMAKAIAPTRMAACWEKNLLPGEYRPVLASNQNPDKAAIYLQTP